MSHYVSALRILTALLLGVFATAVAPVVAWHYTPTDRVYCLPDLVNAPSTQQRPRYRFALGNYNDSTVLLMVGFEAADRKDITAAFPNVTTAHDTVMVSSNGGQSWQCRYSTPAALRYAAVPVSFYTPSCSFACLVGGSDVVNDTLTAPSSEAMCTRDAGETWEAWGTWPSGLHAATALQHGNAIYFFGGMERQGDGSFLPAGVSQVTVDVNTCSLGVATPVLTTSEMIPQLLGRSFAGFAYLPMRNRFVVHGGCDGPSLPGMRSNYTDLVLLLCFDDVWTTTDLAVPAFYSRSAPSVTFRSRTVSNDWIPSVIHEFRRDADMMEPTTSEFITSGSLPSVLIQRGSTMAIAVDALVASFMQVNTYNNMSSTVVEGISPILSAPVYLKGDVPVVATFMNGIFARSGFGDCKTSFCTAPNTWRSACNSASYVPGCLACRTCPPGTYNTGPCGMFYDTQCEPCAPCVGDPNYQRVGGCEGSYDSICGWVSPTPSPTALPSPANNDPGASRSPTPSTWPVLFPSSTPSRRPSSSAGATNSSSAREDGALLHVPDTARHIVSASAAVAIILVATVPITLLPLLRQACARTFKHKPSDSAGRTAGGKGRGHGTDSPAAFAGPQASSTAMSVAIDAARWAVPLALHSLGWLWHAALCFVLVEQSSLLAVGCASVLTILLMLRILHGIHAGCTSAAVDPVSTAPTMSATNPNVSLFLTFVAVAFSHPAAAHSVAVQPVAARAVGASIGLHMLMLLLPTFFFDVLVASMLMPVLDIMWQSIVIGALLLNLQQSASCWATIKSLRDRHVKNASADVPTSTREETLSPYVLATAQGQRKGDSSMDWQRMRGDRDSDRDGGAGGAPATNAASSAGAAALSRRAIVVDRLMHAGPAAPTSPRVTAATNAASPRLPFPDIALLSSAAPGAATAAGHRAGSPCALPHTPPDAVSMAILDNTAMLMAAAAVAPRPAFPVGLPVRGRSAVNPLSAAAAFLSNDGGSVTSSDSGSGSSAVVAEEPREANAPPLEEQGSGRSLLTAITASTTAAGNDRRQHRASDPEAE